MLPLVSTVLQPSVIQVAFSTKPEDQEEDETVSLNLLWFIKVNFKN